MSRTSFAIVGVVGILVAVGLYHNNRRDPPLKTAATREAAEAQRPKDIAVSASGEQITTDQKQFLVSRDGRYVRLQALGAASRNEKQSRSRTSTASASSATETAESAANTLRS